jgi:site-specific recombinase
MTMPSPREAAPPEPRPSLPTLTLEGQIDLKGFGAVIAPSAASHRQVKALFKHLERLDPSKTHDEQEGALELLVRWVRRGGEPPPIEGNAIVMAGPEKRLRMLALALERFPTFRRRLASIIGSLLAGRSAVSFLAKVGIPGDRGLFAETTDRLSRRLMPQPVDEEDVTDLLARLFPAKADALWLEHLPSELTLRFVRSLREPTSFERVADHRKESGEGGALRSEMLSVADLRHSIPPASHAAHAGSIWAPLRGALLDGILLLASRVSAAGLTDAIRARSPATRLRESPFFCLPRMIDNLLDAPRNDAEEAGIWAKECRNLVSECRVARRAVVQQLESQGVSVDVVYRLELIDRSLDRLEQLVDLLVPQQSEQLVARATRMLSRLLAERRRERSLNDIVRTNTRLLARKIIERAGHTGEHYITVSKGEWLKMILSAGGGGILTAATAAGKFMIGALARPPLQEGLLSAANYAGSFLVMQFLGFTLATKQPSMTAAALAGSLKSGDDFTGMVTTIARITRSQLAAAAGNIGMVIPACWGLDYAAERFLGRHFLDANTAEYVIGSLHPTQSGTIPYAAFTGVLLWTSSLAAGWLENWAVYRRLPEAIAEHRARRIFGKGIMGWLSRVFARNVSGVGGNTALGTLLAMTPIASKFTGIPIDVRHVTLSTGALTLAALAMGPAALRSENVHAAALGIAIIGALNFGVSFVLALAVAMRAREVPISKFFRLGWEVTKSFVRGPLRFFLPVGEKPGATAHH